MAQGLAVDLSPPGTPLWLEGLKPPLFYSIVFLEHMFIYVYTTAEKMHYARSVGLGYSLLARHRRVSTEDPYPLKNPFLPSQAEGPVRL